MCPLRKKNSLCFDNKQKKIVASLFSKRQAVFISSEEAHYSMMDKMSEIIKCKKWYIFGSGGRRLTTGNNVAFLQASPPTYLPPPNSWSHEFIIKWIKSKRKVRRKSNTSYKNTINMLFLSERKVKRACSSNRDCCKTVFTGTQKSSCLHFTEGAKLSVKLKSLWTFLISYWGGRASPHPRVSVVNISPSR